MYSFSKKCEWSYYEHPYAICVFMFIHIIISIYTYLRALSYIHTVYKVTFIVSNNNWWEIILLDQSTYVVLLDFKGGHREDAQYPHFRPGRAQLGTWLWSDWPETEPQKNTAVSWWVPVISWYSLLSQGKNLSSRCIEQTSREVPGSIRISSSHLKTCNPVNQWKKTQKTIAHWASLSSLRTQSRSNN